MKRSTLRRRQSYVWAKFFIVQFSPSNERERRPSNAPSSSATQGYGTAVRWR
ncbi:MAG: hypothetical protein M3M94_03745 [Actinomycetota bacterium]|nr:hypothetical protein [Actinomycetota bacterium]